MTPYDEIEAASSAVNVVPLSVDAVHPWPDPIPLIRPPDPPEVYPVEAFGVAQPVVAALHDVTQAPVEICGQSVLSVISLGTQGLFDVELLYGRSPLSIFAITVAASGERKSTVDRLAMKAIREFEQELADERADALVDYEAELSAWQKARKDAIATYSGADLTAELRHIGAEPIRPLLSVISMSDPTIEAITKSMAIARPARGIFTDEGGMLLGGHGMTTENRMKTTTALSKLWDGDPISRARAGDGIETYAGRRTAMHMMLQPVVAEAFLADPLANGQGLLARCLIACPDSTAGTRVHREPSERSLQVIDVFTGRIGHLLRRDMPLREGTMNELDLPLLHLSREARVELIAVHDKIEAAMGVNGELAGVRAFASKLSEHICRIAGVLSVFKGQQEITAERIKAATRLGLFYQSEAQRLLGAAQVAPVTQEAETLRRWLLDTWPEHFISAADIAQRGPNSLRETAKAQRLLDVLSKHGWVRTVSGGAVVNGNRRRKAYEIYGGARP